MRDKKVNTIYRMLPCYRYDILAIEAWLEDMAAEGYILKKFRWLGAVFEKREPMRLRYRILLNPEGNILNKDGITAHESFVALQQNNGWQYYGEKYIGFSVFVCGDDQIAEPDRDIHAWMNRWRSYSIWTSVIFAMVAGAIFAWLAIKDLPPVLFFIKAETWKWLFLILGYPIFSWIGDSMKIRTMRKYLRDDTYIKPDWRKNIRRNRVINYLEYIVLLLVMLCIVAVGNVGHQKMVPLEEQPYTVSFPLVEDFVDAEFMAQSRYKTEVYTESDLLAPKVLEVRQEGFIGLLGEQPYYSTVIGIEYYETHTSGLATKIAKGYYKMDKASYERRGFSASSIIMYDLPDLGIDFANAYQCRNPIIVLAEGKQVVHIECYDQKALGDITLEELAQIYADYLLRENDI